MDYARSDRAEGLAAAYVLGTLRGRARRRFEALLPAHPPLRQVTREWEERLLPLTAVLPPVQPSGEVWRRISDRIEGQRGANARGASSGWRSLTLWRGLSAAFAVTTLGLAVLLAMPRDVPPPLVVVLAPTGAAPELARSASLVVSVSGDRHTLVARPIGAATLPGNRSLELWAIPTQGPPRSLGVLPGGNATVALPDRVLAGTDTLAVSVEPSGGSPSGSPTGPVVYAGKFTL